MISKIICIIYKWQSLIGAAMGAFSAFFLWWFAEGKRKKVEREENISFFHKAVVDQINSLLGSREVIKLFITEKIDGLLLKKRTEGEKTYSVDMAFFPLFSTRPLSDDLQKKGTGSSFVDNKLLRVFFFSQDFPHIIEDIRKQFDRTLDLNKEMAFNKFNTPNDQRSDYIKNLQNYRNIIWDQIIEKNIPIFFKALVECLVAIEELRSIGLLRWKLKFDVKYKFYFNIKKYEKEKRETYERIDSYFRPIALKRINKIEDDYKNNKC